jgi:ribosome-associated toxin RatA of RatAB toxin-antitoxin module
MKVVDEGHIRATPAGVFAAAKNVEQWPTILPHYRWVRTLEQHADRAVVEMSANRPFGPLDWPTWWVSDMWVDEARYEVRYRHIRGITRGMEVVWRVVPEGDGTHVTIIHEWDGPPWPLIRWIAATWVIGPVFVHGIASRTLAGIRRAVEADSGLGPS